MHFLTTQHVGFSTHPKLNFVACMTQRTFFAALLIGKPASCTFQSPVSSSPFHAGYPSSLIFSGSLISHRINTAWGDHSLVAATRALIAAAMMHPDNAWFVLVSESDIPLYDPLTFYLQLMSESKSRVNACPQAPAESMARRWSERMATPTLNATHWRKDSQWVALQRRHASILLQDGEIYTR